MKWVKRWGYEMAEKPVRPGTYRLKDGGFFVRAKVTEPRTGKRRVIAAVLREVKTPNEAQRELDRLVDVARAELRGETRSSPLWASFAVSLLAEKVARGDIESASYLERWQDALKDYLIPEFGHLRATDLQFFHIDRWITEKVLVWMTKGKVVQKKRKTDQKPLGKPRLVKLKPPTVNGILRVLRTICEAVRVKFSLPKSAFDGIQFLPEGRIYSRENPNSLPPGELLARFLELAERKYPQHSFMILLGFITGARPGELRPLRKSGPSPDVDWKTGHVTIRRSHSRGHTVKDSTKTKRDRTIALPPVVVAAGERHVARLTGKAAESELLFPAEDGRLRSRGVLAKPFAAICKELGEQLGYRVTPRGMRRTFNDLAREVGIAGAVTRSITGHATEEMQLHYSTARDAEQLAALERAHALATGRKAEEEPR